jgi:choline dehydrogenase-like flavoprotein
VPEKFSLIAVGTGFASSFFLHEWLKHAKPTDRVLVLEAGRKVTHAQQIERRVAGKGYISDDALSLYHNRTSTDHVWTFSRDFGGGSNCWWAQTPRQLPSDFKLKTLHGHGEDWPFSYDDLESYYCDAEQIMNVAGPDDQKLWPMSRPYPLPPHALMATDLILKKAYPETFTATATAIPSRTVGTRPPCCNSQFCHLCPVNAKFTIENSMHALFDDPRVTLLIGATVKTLDVSGNQITRLNYRHEERDKSASADLFVLGANALFNPHIMLRSGITHPQLGVGLNEVPAREIYLELSGIENFQGGTVNTGLGYMSYEGPHRSKHAGMRMVLQNKRELLRPQRGKWRQRLPMIVTWETLRHPGNRVLFDPADPDRPVAVFDHTPQYTQDGMARLEQLLKPLTDVLPVESINYAHWVPTGGHIQGTHVMGNDPATSITDGFGLSHQHRNLMLLGSGSFPTSPTANPTLTLSAMALRSARSLFASQHLS